MITPKNGEIGNSSSGPKLNISLWRRPQATKVLDQKGGISKVRLTSVHQTSGRRRASVKQVLVYALSERKSEVGRGRRIRLDLSFYKHNRTRQD